MIEGNRIGVAGASMGGMTTLGAFARYPWVSAAANFMGSGYFTALAHRLFPPLDTGREVSQAAFEKRLAPLADYDLTHQLEAIAERPLLVWHGEADDVVPAIESERLVRALAASGRDKHLTYLTEVGMGHKITPTALSAGVRFFTEHL